MNPASRNPDSAQDRSETQPEAAVPLVHTTGAGPPQSLQDLSRVLYSTFRVEGGAVHLAGCSLEDVPLVVVGDENEQRFYDLDGNRLADDLGRSLGLEHRQPLGQPPRSYGSPRRQQWLMQRLRATDKPWIGSDPADSLHNVTLVWCKWARGKLAIDIGRQSAAIEFAGWIKRLVDGPERVPAFVCPLTGIQSYHVVADDEGTITAAEAIERCEVSQKRLVRSKLSVCDVTGKRVERGQLVVCPITGLLFLPDAGVTCRGCRRLIAPRAGRGGLCGECTRLETVPGGDRHLEPLLDRHPGLRQWRNWRQARAGDRWILEAHHGISLIRVLVAAEDKVEKDDSSEQEGGGYGEVLAAATGMRWPRRLWWRSAARVAKLLQGVA